MRAKEALLGMSGVRAGMKLMGKGIGGPMGNVVSGMAGGLGKIKSFFGKSKQQQAPNMGSRGVPPTFGGQQAPGQAGGVPTMSFANMAKAGSYQAGVVSGMEKAAISKSTAAAAGAERVKRFRNLKKDLEKTVPRDKWNDYLPLVKHHDKKLTVHENWRKKVDEGKIKAPLTPPGIKGKIKGAFDYHKALKTLSET